MVKLQQIENIKRLSLEEMTEEKIFGKEKAEKITKIAEAKAEKAIKELKEEIKERDKKMNVSKHKVLLDNNKFKEKPTKCISAIQNRIHRMVKEVSINELAKAIQQGRTFKTSVLSGKTKDTFVSSSLIALDFDNKGKELEKYGYKSLDSFLKDIETATFKPCIVYNTFSNTEECNKYRAIFQLDKEIKDIEELNRIAKTIRAEYPYADEKVSVTHCIFGGTSVVYLNEENIIDVDNMDMVQVENKKASKNTYKPVSIKTIVRDKIGQDYVIANLKKINLRNVEIDVSNSFDWINKNIKLTDVLGYSLDTSFRCIFEEHDDIHPSARISETAEGRQNYICSCTNTYISLIDVLAKFFKMDKIEVQYLISALTGLTVGSRYQQAMRLYIVDVKSNLHHLIEEGSKLDKEMKHLYGAYGAILDFACSNITMKPLTRQKEGVSRPTFYLSVRELESYMDKFNIKGASGAKKKLEQLRELGLIRALRDDEIDFKALSKAKELKEQNNFKYRTQFFELCRIDDEMIAKAEKVIDTRKELGIKKNKNNIFRRCNGYGKEFTKQIHVQSRLDNLDKKSKALYEKIINEALQQIEKKGYFTYNTLNLVINKHRKVRKRTFFKLIDDIIPLLLNYNSIKKNRVTKLLKNKYDLSENINSIIFVAS